MTRLIPVSTKNPVCMVSANTITSLSTTAQPPPWDTVELNTHSMADLVNKRIRVRRTGYYSVSINIYVNAASTSSDLWLAIQSRDKSDGVVGTDFEIFSAEYPAGPVGQNMTHRGSEYIVRGEKGGYIQISLDSTTNEAGAWGSASSVLRAIFSIDLVSTV